MPYFPQIIFQSLIKMLYIEDGGKFAWVIQYWYPADLSKWQFRVVLEDHSIQEQNEIWHK